MLLLDEAAPDATLLGETDDGGECDSLNTLLAVAIALAVAAIDCAALSVGSCV